MKRLIPLLLLPALAYSQNVTLSSDMDAFLTTANDAAARTELGALAAADIDTQSEAIAIRTDWAATGITASTTQTQGNGVLTAERNFIGTVANASDTVTAFGAYEGARIWVYNGGANAAQLFPASGDNLGAGLNTAVSLAVGEIVEYEARDATNWVQVPNTTNIETIDLEYQDQTASGPLATDGGYNGIARTGGVSAAATAKWKLVYRNSARKWAIADSSVAVASYKPATAVAVTSTAGADAAITVVQDGIIRNDAWTWTAGAELYVSSTGDFTATAPATTLHQVQPVGVAITDDEIELYDLSSPTWLTNE